jgi:hypothetical protein
MIKSYERLIEIGGGDRPILPNGLIQYTGIDPDYGRSGPRNAVRAACERASVQCELVYRSVDN